MKRKEYFNINLFVHQPSDCGKKRKKSKKREKKKERKEIKKYERRRKGRNILTKPFCTPQPS
jgi:hypothetical protein